MKKDIDKWYPRADMGTQHPQDKKIGQSVNNLNNNENKFVIIKTYPKLTMLNFLLI